MTKLTLQKVFYIRWQYIKTQNKIPNLKTLIAVLTTNATGCYIEDFTHSSLNLAQMKQTAINIVIPNIK